MEPGRNRVFINPNFNKGLVNSDPVRQGSVMHVNPNFYKHPQNVQPVPKTKIYVNRNFVKPNDVNIQPHAAYNVSATHPAYAKPSPLMDSSNTLTVPIIAPTKHVVHSSIQPKPFVTQAFQTHSRYSLVRQKQVAEPQTSISRPQSSTVKINKYKSIKITDIKKSLDSVVPIVKKSSFQVSKDHKSMIRSSINEKVIPKTLTSNFSRYNLVRQSAKPQIKRQSSVTKKIVIRSRIKAVGAYKKNNIPCPQYRKYGKCLRKLYGHCEFLHDKKHVSICRKFLNGVCHNNACLLSHELSDKKMPTCYFYLKGMCTKEGCPYLHVKLNEKAKICPDFMKGYCEKGDKCLYRHVTSAKPSNTDLKRRRSLNKSSSQKLMKYKLEKNKIKSNTSSTPKRKSKIQQNAKSSQENIDLGGRYYKDSVQETSTSESLEMIKPMRCKLGTLPSFIQL